MNQTNHFFNLGYGWLCKHCSAEAAERKLHPHNSHSHGHREEDKGTNSLALAHIRPNEFGGHSLSCPRCGIEEPV